MSGGLDHSLSASRGSGERPGDLALRLVVEAPIARGGMGAVHRAVDRVTGQRVALKTIRPDLADPQSLARFAREGRVGGALDHPNVVRVLMAGTWQGLPSLVLELVEGPSLADRVRQGGPLDPAEACRLLAPIARALAQAHRLGLLHRDLKPANVLVGPGEVPKLVDFGVVRLAGRERLTATGEVVGTPNYMAPEQALGDEARFGPPLDVWGLGATLYELVTGAPPFAGPTAMATFQAVLHAPLVPASTRRPGLDPRVDALLARALAKDPAARFPSAEHLARELEALARGGAPRGARRARAGRVGAGPGRLVVGLGATAAITVVAAGLAVVGRGLGRAPAGRAPGSTPAAPPGPDAPRAAPAPADVAPTTRAPDPARAEAERWLARGATEAATGRAAAACDAFERAAELAPDEARAWAGLGRARLDRDRAPGAAAARDALERAVALDPARAAAWSDLAQARWWAGDPDGAARDVARALELDPTLGPAWRISAGLALGRAEPDLALEHYSRALAHGVDDASTWNLRGTVHQQRGDLRAAVADYGEALARDPRLAAALENRVRCLVALGDVAAAVPDLDLLAELGGAPTGASPAECLGMASLYLARGGDLEGALARAERGLALDPGNLSARTARGLIRRARGELDGAVADLEHALGLQPDAEMLVLLGQVHWERADRRAALRAWQRALDLSAGAPQLASHRAEFERRRRLAAALEQAEEAEASLRALEAWVAWSRVVAAHPDVATGLLGRARARARFGDRAGALEDARRAQAQEPVAREARALLAALEDPGRTWAPPAAVEALRQVEGAAAREDWAAVGRALEQAAAGWPEAPAARLTLGAARLLAGDVPGAVTPLERLAAAAPGDPWAAAALARAWQHGGDLDRALAAATRGLAGEAPAPGLLLLRAEVLAARGDLAGALADLERALSLRRPTPSLLTTRGLLRSDRGDLAGARADLDAAIALDPDHGAAWAARGSVRRLQGDLDGAISDLEQALPRSPPALQTEAARELEAWRRERAAR